jgi:hypothetical protein
VDLEVTVRTDVNDPESEVDGLNFDTSRYALASAADAVRALDGSWDTSEIDEELES